MDGTQFPPEVAAVVRRLLEPPPSPRYRFWRVGDRTYEYTTTRAKDSNGDGDPRYWAVERRWRRTSRGETGQIHRQMGFVTRKKAKERAYRWYQARQETVANQRRPRKRAS